MNEFIYVGTLTNPDGNREVNLKKGAHHWIDTDGHRWRFFDGENASRAQREADNRTFLLLYTVRHNPELHSLAINLKMTHEGRIKGPLGKGKLFELRETVKHWVDKFGNKYRKENGWEAKEQKTRLVLDSIMPLPIADNIKQRPRRPRG